MLLENGDDSPGDHLTPNTDEVKDFVVPAQIVVTIESYYFDI